MGKSLKVNATLNLIYAISGFLFPLITFPYASRIIGAEGIGLVNYLWSIVGYVFMFCSLGLPMYGVKEIAKVRDDADKVARTTQEILLVTTVLSVIAYTIVLLLICFVPKISAHPQIFLILSSYILFQFLGCDWFYQGMEDFSYTTVRGITVRSLTMIVLFTTVHSSDDILWYAFYTTSAVVGNNVFNFIHLRKYGVFKNFSLKRLRPTRHLRAMSRVFVLSLVSGLYINLAQVMLGSIGEMKDVGYFTAAFKVISIFMVMIAAFGSVVLPRLSHLVESGEMETFRNVAQKSADFLTALTLPCIAGLLLLAPDIILLISGPDFIAATPTLRILAPVIFLISVSSLIGIQILYPLGKEKIVIVSTLAGTAINLLINVTLIPHWAHSGAGFATVATELVIVIAQLWIGRKYIPITFFNRHFLQCAVATLAFSVLSLGLLEPAGRMRILVIPVVAGAVYFLLLWWQKNSLLTEQIETLKRRFLKRP